MRIKHLEKKCSILGPIDPPLPSATNVLPSRAMDPSLPISLVLLQALVVDLSPSQHPTPSVGSSTKGIPHAPPCVCVPNDIVFCGLLFVNKGKITLPLLPKRFLELWVKISPTLDVDSYLLYQCVVSGLFWPLLLQVCS